jgi:ABC-type nitrate/sulfonate/bicarbonate transport system permease component
MNAGVTVRSAAAVPPGSGVLDDYRRARRDRGRMRILRRLAVLGVLMAAWELAGRSVNPVIFPTFTSTLHAWYEMTRTGALFVGIAESLRAMLVGFGISLAIGIPVGLLMGRYRTADAILQVYLTAVLAVPMIALFPFIIVVFGIAYAAEVAVVVLFVVVYVTTTTAAGIRSTSLDLLEMADSFMLSERQQFRWVMLPAAAPLIMAGVRLGFGRAVTGMLLAELLLVGTGLGGMLDDAHSRFDSASSFAVVLTILLVAVVGVGLIQALDRRINAWRPALDR